MNEAMQNTSPASPNLILQAASCSQMNETMQNTSPVSPKCPVNPNLFLQTKSYSQINETKKNTSPVNQNSTEQSQSKSQICFPNQCSPSLLYEGYFCRNLNKKSQDHSKVPTVIIPSKYKRQYFISELPKDDHEQKSVIDLSAASQCPIYSEIALTQSHQVITFRLGGKLVLNGW